MRRPSPAGWRSRRSIASCAARARRRRPGKVRTVSSPGCSAARRLNTTCRCRRRGEAKRAILDTYTKEHSAEYQSQALIDLARRPGAEGSSQERFRRYRSSIVIHTSHHTHYVIGTGANDPQKMDPKASRETLDHSIMYIFAVALEDGGWHHERSYAPARATGRRRSRSGTRFPPSRMPSGRGAITAAIRRNWRLAAASSSP